VRGLIAAVACLALTGVSARAAEPSRWSGAYVGFNAGIDIGQNGILDNLAYTTPGTYTHLNGENYNHVTVGGIFGGQIGYNWEAISHLVLGIEADWVYDDSENLPACVATCLSTPPGPPFSNYAISLTDRERLRWFGTVRPRLGYVTGDTLWYLTAGGVGSRIDVSLRQTVSVSGAPSPLVPSFVALTPIHYNLGFTVGWGIETRLIDNWTLKAEYLYLDLGGVSNTYAVSEAGNTSGIAGAVLTTVTNSHLHDHIFRVGANYRFWSWVQ
jgi:outer membrane immunogenic protein